MSVLNKSFIMRIFTYVIGLFILALGVTFAINSNLGVSPVSSFPYVISVITGLDMGMWTIIIYTVFILIQIIILKKEFKLINLTQIIFSTIFGYFINFAKLIVGDFVIPTYFGRLIMLAISIFLIALGVSLYVSAKLVNMPMEGMVAAINHKILKKHSFADVKVIMDSVVVFIGITLSLIFLGKVVGIREGTVLSAILVGKVMKPIQKFIVPRLKGIGV